MVNTAAATTEWNNAVNSLSKLEDPVTSGLANGIPYGVLPGNHDTSSSFNTYFGVSRFNGRGILWRTLQHH